MSLPESYLDPEIYLKDTLNFLCEYQWLFNVPNTHILVKNIFQNVNIEWIPHLKNLLCDELNNITAGYINDSWPESLKIFLNKINNLKPRLDPVDDVDIKDLPKKWFDGVSVKKKHEILSFAPMIHKHCSSTDVIVDVGAGLGYLPQLLYEKYKYKILSIESDSKKCEAAKQRQEKHYCYSKNDVKYVQHYVTEESTMHIDSFIESFMKTDPKNIKISLVGLHACADLTITMLKLFFKMPNVYNIVIMPCCYHRMQINNFDDSASTFINFPVSKVLKDISEINKADEFFNVPFLRLACQNSSATWRKMSADDHLKHARSLLRRNVLQLVAEEATGEFEYYSANFCWSLENRNNKGESNIFKFINICELLDHWSYNDVLVYQLWLATDKPETHREQQKGFIEIVIYNFV